MPWEKSFDTDEAVNRAMRIFWMKGYEATSMSDLMKGMEINKGSLYNAFGSKKELFNRVLITYGRDNHQAALASLESMDSPQAAITSFFDSLIAESTSDTDHKGCLLMNTALDLPNQDDDVRKMIVEALKDTEAFFVRCIKRGQKSGEISKTIKASETGKALLGPRCRTTSACPGRIHSVGPACIEEECCASAV